MKIIDTSQVDPKDLKPYERDWVYNGLDCCLTAEILDVIKPQLDEQTSATYDLSRALQGPVLDMRIRGVLVDQQRKAEVVELYYNRLDQMEKHLNRLIEEGCEFYDCNWRSTKDLKNLFYDHLGIPEIRKRKTGAVTVDRDALERLEHYLVVKPIVLYMQAMRDLKKKIEALQTAIDPDGRIRTSYNIAGTVTGRFSSSLSEFGTGGNLQNIEEELRSVFIADPGMKMAYFDAEQGESRCVGATLWNIFEDGTYLDACEGGDLHTSVAKVCWPMFQWTGDPRKDKELAEQPYYRHYSYRFMCKKIGHGSNYGGKPSTLAQQAKIDQEVIEEFQPKYFSAFPAIPDWHEWVKDELYETGKLTTLSGRRRQFWGRRDQHDTLREAIAYDPQGSLADIVNTGMLHLWRSRVCQLLMQVHDAVVVQFPEALEDEIVPRIAGLLRVPVHLQGGRDLIIPYGCKTGWNFGPYSKDNPDGLKGFKGADDRKRSPKIGILDRPFRRAYG